MKTLYMRIHPQHPQRGYRAARMSIYGYLFLESQGWYRAQFSDEQWAYLKNVRNDDLNPDSPRVFQIVDEVGKKELEAEERQAKIMALSQNRTSMVDLTTQDVRGDAPVVRAERERSMRAADFDRAERATEPTIGEDLAEPAAHASATAAPASAEEKRGRGRPRKVVGSVTPV